MALGYATIFNSYFHSIRIGTITRSPALRAAFVFGGSGVLFAVSNLIFARVMPKIEFATFVLFFALVQIGIALGPAGIQIIVNRKNLDPSIYLFKKTLFISFMIGGLIIAICSFIYNIHIGLLILLLYVIIIGSTNSVAAAHFQSKQHFGISLFLTQNRNLFFAIAAFTTLIFKFSDAWLPCVIIAAGYTISAVSGSVKLLSNQSTDIFSKTHIPWRESITILGFSAAVLIMSLLERLIVPKVLSIEALATLGVLMTLAGSPFKILEGGIRFTMLPRFRDANGAEGLRRLLAKEGMVVLFVVIFSSLIVWFLAPILVKWVLPGKYDISQALLAAAVIAGFAKIFDAFSATALTALGSSKELGVFSFLSWISLAISATGAFIGACWGLEGVIYGVASGWYCRASIALVLSRKYFHFNEKGAKNEFYG